MSGRVLDAAAPKRIDGRLIAVAFFLAVLAFEAGLVLATAGPPPLDQVTVLVPP
jgi:hypothetical protein